MSKPGRRTYGRDIIFEFQSVGDYVRVAAVDVKTGEEVMISGPVDALQADLERVAARKLLKKLGLDPDAGEKQTPRRGGRGVIV